MKNQLQFKIFCRTYFLLIAALTCVQCVAQHGYYGSYVPPYDRSPNHLILTINPQDGAYLKKDLGQTDLSTDIRGEKVLGIPFLVWEWSSGTITTDDGRIYSYPLRYDVYKQAVSFLNGKDSLEIADPIKEFTLDIALQDTAIHLHFINASQFGKEKRIFFYQVIVDGKNGQLLKSNRKVVKSLTDGLLEEKGHKYFDLQGSYFYYDARLKKITKLDAKGTNVKEIEGVKSNQKLLTQLNSFDLSNDEELIRFFRLYFESE
jgi:hypothetical protein